MTILKSIGAVVAGFVVVAALSIATDAILASLQILPGASLWPDAVAPWMLMLALFYRSVYTILGGYVTAWLAPKNPMMHVYVLAALGFVSGTAGMIVGWNLSAHWYPLALAITGPIFVWIGGVLRMRVQENAAKPTIESI